MAKTNKQKPINLDRVTQWKDDVAKSVDFYNKWFLKFAPQAYKDTRTATAERVSSALDQTDYLTDIKPSVLKKDLGILSILRMATRPALARDRLIGLSSVPSSLVTSMEQKSALPARMPVNQLNTHLKSISQTLHKLIDVDIFTWLEDKKKPNKEEKERASIIIADRLCGTTNALVLAGATRTCQIRTSCFMKNPLIFSSQHRQIQSYRIS